MFCRLTRVRSDEDIREVTKRANPSTTGAAGRPRTTTSVSSQSLKLRIFLKLLANQHIFYTRKILLKTSEKKFCFMEVITLIRNILFYQY